MEFSHPTYIFDSYNAILVNQYRYSNLTSFYAIHETSIDLIDKYTIGQWKPKQHVITTTQLYK